MPIKWTSLYCYIVLSTQDAEKRWTRLHGFVLMADIIVGIEFENGIKQVEKNDRNVANISPRLARNRLLKLY